MIGIFQWVSSEHWDVLNGLQAFLESLEHSQISRGIVAFGFDSVSILANHKPQELTT